MKRRFFTLLGCFIVLLAIIALAMLVGKERGEVFQQDAVSSRFLEFGETGKILRKINAILPIENKERGKDYFPSPTEIIGKAADERKKWLQLSKFAHYKDKVFVYIELESDDDNNRLAFFTKKNEEWILEHSIPASKDRTFLAFFIDRDGPKVPIQFAFNNASTLKIKSAVFLQKGYHPLVFADAIALRRLFSGGVNTRCSAVAGGVTMPTGDAAALFKFKLRFKNKWMTGISKYHKKQGESPIQYTTAKYHPLRDKLHMSDTELRTMSKVTVPVLALEVADEDLYSEKAGILKNFDEHGRDWERMAKVRLYREGQEVINSFTGIRLHGGGPGREKGLINFRIYLRDQYGLQEIPSTALFDRDVGMIKRFAVKQCEWEQWPLNSPVSYDIAHQIGALAPPTELVQLYLNGKHLGLYYIVPSPNEKQLGLSLNDDSLRFYRERSDQHFVNTAFHMQQFWLKFRSIETLTEESASKFFDLENLAGQLFSYIYCGTEDFCQGVVLKSDAPNSRMFWYTWDMDQSFIDVTREVGGIDTGRQRWEKYPSFANFFNPDPDFDGSNELCPRVVLFKSLVNADPEYRQKALSSFLAILNHKLTDEFFTALLAKYEDKLERSGHPYGRQYIANLRDYVQHRKSFLIKNAETYFKTQPFATCEITSNEYPISVDGYEKNSAYEGFHRIGDTLIIRPPATKPGRWTLNGQPVMQEQAAYRVSGETECKVQLVVGK
jgi:hypothetical protein